MILGLDTGLKTCGWALLDERRCSFLDLGVVIQPQKKHLARTVTLERARRANIQAGIIAAKAPGCSTVVVEQLSMGVGGRIAQVSIGISWGIVLGVVATLPERPRLLTIAPQVWQREVCPSVKGKVDYETLATAVGWHILKRHPLAAEALRKIDDDHKQHAIDAAMIALVGALRPHRCDEVGQEYVAL